jgi:uncharacterized protein YraI
MSRKVFAAAAVAGILALPGAALAQTAVVSTDLNVRLGPGPTYEVMTVVPVNETVTIHGCLVVRKCVRPGHRKPDLI